MSLGWSAAKPVALEQQYGMCPVCGFFLKGDFVAHHVQNRSQGGPSTLANMQLRHTRCERYMHQTFRFGNYGQEDIPSAPVVVTRKHTSRKYYRNKPYRGQGRRR